MGLINVIIRDPLNSCNLSQHLESPGIMVTSEGGGGDPTVRDELSVSPSVMSANGEREQERDIQPQPDPEIDRKVETLVGCHIRILTVVCILSVRLSI